MRIAIGLLLSFLSQSSAENKSAAAALGSVRGATEQGRVLQGETICRLWQSCTQFEPTEESSPEEEPLTSHDWFCEMESHQDKRLVGDGVQAYLDGSDIASGDSVLILSQATEYPDILEFDVSDIVGIEPYEVQVRSRKLVSSLGTMNTLVVRVTATDSNPVMSANQLSSDVFTDPVCLKSQTNKCSYGKAVIEEYVPGAGVHNIGTSALGVVDINISIPTSGNSKYVISGAAKTELTTLLGGDPGNYFDLVLFCMPPGAAGYWLAYAYVNRYDSYYNGAWCQRVSAQMHEVGHNWFLHHSGDPGGSEYGDKSGYMGSSYYGDDTPEMCYNAAKNWQLNWYADKQIEIDPTDANDICKTQPRTFMLNGLVDYGSITAGAHIVIKIANFYLGFNRPTSFNVGTQEVRNQVTVVYTDGTGWFSAIRSRMQEGMNVGDSTNMVISPSLTVGITYISNTNSKDAIIELTVSGADAADCPTPTNPPTITPPTPPPTFQPTNPPTNPPPTNPPTIAPTVTPVGWQCTAANMLPAPKACGPGIPSGYYPDLTDPRAYCHCTGTLSPGNYQVCNSPLVWNPFPGGVGQYLNVMCPGGVNCGANGLWGTIGGTCDWSISLPTPPPTPAPVTPTNPPTKSPTSAPLAWACVSSNFSGGSGQCGPGFKAGYYPDLTRKNAYCFCTGTAAPSRYEVCPPPLRWDSFFNNWGQYIGGNLSGVPHGKHGYWGTKQGMCNWASAISPKTKHRPPY